MQLSQYSFFQALISIILAAAVAYGFYYFKTQKTFTTTQIRWLTALRAVLLGILCYMLFSPLVKLVSYRLEKPLIVLAQDASASIINGKQKIDTTAYNKALANLSEKLAEKYEVKTFNFGKDINEGLPTSYKASQTNISALVDALSTHYANRNVGAVILGTDGIYNQGVNPLYQPLSFNAPIYSIALGDTTIPKDVSISNVEYNALAYLGNDFGLNIGINAYDLNGNKSTLTVRTDEGVIFTKEILIDKNNFIANIPLSSTSKKIGIIPFNISLSPIKGEANAANNTKTVFVEVLDGKEKILLVGAAPHPDITALRQVLSLNKNYELTYTTLENLSASINMADYEVAILHQIPGAGNAGADLVNKLNAKNIPTLYIVGNGTDVNALNNSGVVKINNFKGQYSEAQPIVSDNFSYFILSNETKAAISNLPPLNAPFGVYNSAANAAILLKQKIGSAATENPLLTFYTKNDGTKQALLAGEGLWRWNLYDYKNNSNKNAVNELIFKTIQYLATKDDKRKFRLYTNKTNYDASEDVIFSAELYNANYENINTATVTVKAKSTEGKTYDYTLNPQGNAYALNAGILPAGVYNYSGTAINGSQKETAGGRFLISEQNLELSQLTANHTLLYALANKTGGKVYYPTQIEALEKLLLESKDIKTLSFEDIKFEELINIKWLFILLVILAGTEWVIRKWAGRY